MPKTAYDALIDKYKEYGLISYFSVHYLKYRLYFKTLYFPDKDEEPACYVCEGEGKNETKREICRVPFEDVFEVKIAEIGKTWREVLNELPASEMFCESFRPTFDDKPRKYGFIGLTPIPPNKPGENRSAYDVLIEQNRLHGYISYFDFEFSGYSIDYSGSFYAYVYETENDDAEVREYCWNSFEEMLDSEIEEIGMTMKEVLTKLPPDAIYIDLG